MKHQKTKSEKVLGDFLAAVPRDSYLISDKFTPQCADPTADNAVTALIPLAKSGKIGKIGLSNHSLAEIKEAAGILSKEGLKISAIQNHYSLLNRSSETSGILDYCTDPDRMGY